LFEFLEAMPATWDESKVLSSDINQYIITARRTVDDWFIGAAINEEGGNLPLKLDFLADNQKYQAKIYADAANTHYIKNREAYEIKTIEVKKGDSLQMKLAPGGGQAIWISPLH
jgi:alpha-glucosidase